MKLTVSTRGAAAEAADLLALTLAQGDRRPAGNLPAGLAREVERQVARSGFTGKEGKTLVLGPLRGVQARRVIVIGLGDAKVDLAERTRRAAGVALGKTAEHGARTLALLPPADDDAIAEATALGALLADYRFTRYKSAADNGDGQPKLAVRVLAAGAAARRLRAALPALAALARGVSLARDLGNEPSNELTPTRMAEVALDLAKRHPGVKCQVLGPDAIRKLGMGAFLAVAQGSQQEPRFIHLQHGRKRQGGRRVAIVGKGLTFDTGGISIKPAPGMEDMKMDMCGAGAVLGLFECLPDLDLPHEVHGYVAATDNMPSGSAMKPGDVVRSLSGRTIEILNTDAEGRLTLADSLTYAQRNEPEFMVDLATLTGACAVALGSATGIMANDTALREALCRSSDATGERAWPLPLFPDYRRQLRSEVADIKNLGDRYGGALTAGLFLQAWVPDDLPWAHLDIAGSAWTDRELPCCPKGATGVGVRTLAHWLAGLAGPSA